MKRFLAIMIARCKEYWRDRSSLFFTFVVPPFLILVMAFAFSSDQSLLKVGIIGTATTPIPAVLEESYIHRINYDNLDTAMRRLKHHQVDMLIEPDSVVSYWINVQSDQGKVLKALLHTDPSLATQYHEVSGRSLRYIDWVIPGILGMNLMFSGLFGVGYVIVRYRRNGVLKRLMATPLSAAQFMVAQLVSRLIIMMVVSASIFAIANSMLDLLVLGSYINLLIVALIGNISIISMALVVSARLKSEELANTLLNVLALPMLMFSEAWFSLEAAPEWASYISKIFPLTHMIGAARSVMINGSSLVDISQQLLILGVVSVCCLAIATWLFRWN